jgi:excisionase family DNA binding protein
MRMRAQEEDMEMQNKPLLSSKQRVAEQLGVSVRTIDYLIASGELPTVRIGRRRMVVTKSLDNFCRRDHSTRPSASG